MFTAIGKTQFGQNNKTGTRTEEARELGAGGAGMTVRSSSLHGNTLVLCTLAVGTACVIVAVTQHSAPTVLSSDVSNRVENGVPVFDWSDTHNVNMFNVACAQGNGQACRDLAANQAALKELNRQGRAQSRWTGDLSWTKLGDSWYDEFRTAGDEMVPLDDKYEYNELQGQDLGDTLVPEDDVAFKHQDDDLEDHKIEDIMHRDEESYPRGPHLKVFHGQQLWSALQRQGLQLLVPGGLKSQQGIQSLVVDLCGPDSPYCGPTRPSEDHNADAVLTEPDEYGGWLNTVYECCPCLGRTATNSRIGYDQFENNGYYNPYTMNLCRPCGGCT